MENTNQIRIYMACLASYNNGILHGCWIDPLEGVEAVQEAIAKMLAASPTEGAEEYALHGYEGFEGVSLSEYEGLESIYEMAFFIEDNTSLGAALIAQFHSLEDAKIAITDHYAGCYRSVEDFAQEITEETTDIPDSLRFYIDYEKMARDMLINDVFAIELAHDEVHVFWQF